MSISYYDAHNHLQQLALCPAQLHHYFGQIAGCAVNGTKQADWKAVNELSRQWPAQVFPSYGLHPWEVMERTDPWERELRAFLLSDPRAGVGEIGIDRWVRGVDFAVQKRVFIQQLEMAFELERPATIHCLKAWGTLREILRSSHLPRRFLLHAYGGPREYIDEFLRLGAYFSFSPTFCSERKKAQRDAFQRIPLERIVLETDAPAMLGPPETWSQAQQHLPENTQHPLNIQPLSVQFAQLRRTDLAELSALLQENFKRLFHREESNFSSP